MNSRLSVLLLVLVVATGCFSKGRTGEARPTSSEVTQCWHAGEDCPQGGFQITFGTVKLYVNAVGNGVLIRDVLGDRYATGRTVKLIDDLMSQSVDLVDAKVIIPTGGNEVHYKTALVQIEENGVSTVCHIFKADGARSSGLIVSCDL